MKSLAFFCLWFAAVRLSLIGATTIANPGPVGRPQAGMAAPDIVWLKLNEGSGTSITGDASGGGDDGSTDAAWLTGQSGSGSCLDFNGTDDDAVTTSSITYGSNVITAAFWVYPDSNTSTRILLESSDNFNNSDNAWAVYFNSSNIVATIRDLGVGYRTEQCSAPATGAWAHVLVLFDGSTANGDIKIYLDGVDQSTSTTDNTRNTTANFSAYQLFIGARNSASLFSDGRIDDLRIYSGDKTANVAAIMADSQ